MSSPTDEPPWNDLERDYAERFRTLFAQVDPQQPEKGVKTLLLRARRQAKSENISLAQALEAIYQGAKERTERRVRLLNVCRLEDRD